MKKLTVLIIIALIISFVWGISSGCVKEPEYDGIIRIHIRANSNSEDDQSVKYLVKDALTAYIEPYAKDIKSKAEMYDFLSSHTGEIMDIADSALASCGMDYHSQADMRREEFPARCYDGITFPAGEYDALIVELGTGLGDNWWCVAFPPLCFVGAEDNGTDEFHYKSLIKELLDKE